MDIVAWRDAATNEYKRYLVMQSAEETIHLINTTTGIASNDVFESRTELPYSKR